MQINEAIGSVHYISPEQAKGDYTDNRSDIYSAGAARSPSPAAPYTA